MYGRADSGSLTSGICVSRGVTRWEPFHVRRCGFDIPHRDRLVVPSATAYARAGRGLADLAVHEGFTLACAPRSFVSDVLIATSCRERDIVLVTTNHRDFATIGRHRRRFRCVNPRP